MPFARHRRASHPARAMPARRHAADRHRAARPGRARRRAAGARCGPARLHRRRPAAVGGTVLRDRARPQLLGLLAEVLTDGDVPGARGRRRAGPAGRAARDRPVPAGRAGRRGAATAGCTATTRTRGSCRRSRRSPRSTAGQLRRLHARPGPPGRQRAGPGRRPEPGPRAGRGRGGAGRLDRRRAVAAQVPPLPPVRARRRSLLVDRPGSVQSSIRLGGPAVPRRRAGLPGAAAGEPGLRRLLLLPAGREHPRGQGLHVRPAQPDRATAPPARRSWSTPTSPPR